jgi:L-histidine N-alpha-methyltransferase
MDGLSRTPRRISSMFFYDDRGSRLFEQITQLPEYYPTRIEKGLLDTFARDQGARLSDLDIIELGSGDCSKISLILDAVAAECMASIRYIPVDVSEFAIRQSADRLASLYPGLSVRGQVADFLTQLECLPSPRQRLFCLLGSTIGNLSVTQREAFVQSLSRAMQPGDEFLLGVDLVKPVQVLHRAYNDSQGVTAEFNRNILRVINDLAGTDFDPGRFDHVALYNPDHARVEMHLRATMDMEVTSPHAGMDRLELRRDEMIHTENSHKFTTAQVTELLERTGLSVVSCLQDARQWFALLRARKPGRGRYVRH